MSQVEFVQALGKLPSGLFVLSVRNDVSATAMLASWVQQCSFDPPQISLAIKPDRHIAGLLSEGTAFILNQLAAGQAKLLGHFAKGFAPGESAFSGIAVSCSALGIPIINESLAHLECRVENRFSTGDHDLIIAQVTGGAMHGSGSPYVHIRKSGLNY